MIKVVSTLNVEDYFERHICITMKTLKMFYYHDELPKTNFYFR